MKRKNIDAMREVRLWIGQVIVPAITLGATMYQIPEVRRAVLGKYHDVKEKTKKLFKKN